MSAAVPERRLRGVDWRFLLHTVERPRILPIGRGGDTGLSEVGEIVAADENPDLAVLGFPRPAALRQAAAALTREGEVLSVWRARPWGLRRARRRLRDAGFDDVRFYRPGPDPGPGPARWAPLPPATGQPADPPPSSPPAALRRRLWRLFGPVFAIAARKGAVAGEDPLREALPEVSSWVLLTGGGDEGAKAVGLPLGRSGEVLGAVAKFGRNEPAERGLRREADLLEQLAAERPQLSGVPRLRARARRAGRFAIVQDAAAGQPLNASLDPAAFTDTARAVTGWLLELAGSPQPTPAADWTPRLGEAPLAALESGLGGTPGPDFSARAAAALTGIGALPLVWEHRDFGPWNVLADANGTLCTIDWEDAEPRGLPALDLFYFLVTSLASLERADGEELTRYRRARQALADPSSEPARAAAACLERYCRALKIGAEDLGRLRLLCWLTQAKIGLRHRNAGAASGDAELFAALAGDELENLERER